MQLYLIAIFSESREILTVRALFGTRAQACRSANELSEKYPYSDWEVVAAEYALECTEQERQNPYYENDIY